MDEQKKKLIKQIMDVSQQAAHPLQTLAQHVVDTTTDTAQKNKWTPGGFGHNVAQGAGDLIGGLANMVNPYSPSSIPQAIVHPERIGPGVTNMVEGVGHSLNNAAGQPVNPQTGQIQMPSLAKAAQNFYEKPVDAALNYTMVGGALGKLGKAGEAADAASQAPKGWMSEGMKAKQTAEGLPPLGGKAALGQKMGFVDKTASELAAGKTKPIPQNVVDTFLNQFDVPSKRMYRINGQRVAETVLSDKIPTNFNSLKNYADTLTGSSGELPKMIYRALGDSKQAVDLTDILKSGTTRLDDIPSLGDASGQLAKYKGEMQKMFPVKKGFTGSVDSAVTDPLQAWETMQQLEEYGHAYLNKSTYLTDNPHAERLGRAYIDTAKDIQDALDAQLKNVDMNQYITPEMRQRLGGLSPELLDRFDKTPKTIQNLRSFQKPAVDVSNMIRQTEATAQSVWTKNAKAISHAAGTIVGGGAGSVGGPIGAGAGAFIGNAVLSPVLEPIAEMVLKRYLPDINIGAAKIVSKFAKGGLPSLPSVGGIGGKIAPLGAVALGAAGGNPQNQVSNNSGNNPAGHIDETISPFYQDVKPDQSGHYQLPTQSSASNTFMTAAQRQQLEANLTPGTPEYQRVEQKFKQDQDMAKAQYTPQVAGFMKQAPAIVANSNKVYDDVATFPMGILNNFDSLTKAAKYVDPKYQSFVTALDGLNTGFMNLYDATMGQKPTENMLISPKDSSQQAQVKIAYMNNFFSGTYGNYKDAYAATTSPSGTLTKTGQPIAAPQIAPQAPSDFSQMTQTNNLPEMQLPQMSLPPMGSLGR